MIRFVLSFFGSIFSWLVTAVFFGALTLGAIFWVYSRNLPSHEQLAQYAPKTISRVYSGEGRLIDEFAEERRIFVPIEDIPDVLKQAFISAEDKHFYIHRGYDATGMLKALVQAVQSRGENLRGASTITQQVMKNFLLSSDRSIERKIKELILASRIEETLSKDRILELYLNEIFLGQNSFGVAAAAQTYFNKTLAELEPYEAATLAAMPAAPSNFHPVRNRERLEGRRNHVLREMWQNGYISEQTYRTQRLEPVRSVQNGDYPPFRDALPPRDYFTDEIRRQLSRSFGQEEFFTGGLTIRATVDPEMQDAAARALRQALEDYDRNTGLWRGTGKTLPPEDLASEDSWRAALARVDVPRDIEGWHPAVVLEIGRNDARIGIEGVDEVPGGHHIEARDVTWARKMLPGRARAPRAKVPGDLLEVGDVVHVRAITRDQDGSFVRWSLRQVPRIEGAFMAMDVDTGRVIAMQGGFSYQSSVFNRATQAMRQPGSSFKPFVYAAALDSGFTPATIVVDAPIEVNTPQGMWRPKNASNRFYGPTPLRTGIEQSRNLMTVRIAQEVGMDTVARYAERFGVYNPMKPFLANALGSQETTLFQMVAAYAMFANGGERVEPTLVDRVQDRWGRTIYRHDRRLCEDCTAESLPPTLGPTIVSNRERVMDAITAYQLTSMLQGVVQRGTARSVRLPVPIAGKTGTTNDAKDVWFVGYSSEIVAGCYIGYDTPRSLGGVSGGGTCGPVFQRFMQEAIKKYGGGKFRVPPGGHFIKIDRYSGARLPNEASGPNVVSEYFRDNEDPIFGIGAMVDGGFAMGANLPLFARGESDDAGTTVTTSTGRTRTIPRKSNFGSISAGGLY
ncbi:penicillin-binding protein 1A [Phaeovulum vinaykumarii]|uniref:Penicillin-binding protein 1A n=1 Tax=Phaeovulum vinaykumarii TaxID=407234 RepID=A0A1N7MV10_9RHOB|nr:PBP1A family penicillin-binding protein [Phaeovulum vinaykumarii]SIS89963.1 penicillin-binding protein 1A [Phaeovulum vinaykumarii]SOC16908.1 penicillin-binding protein 1A [Phaeovulum vinaykumarii]